jgi:hypothetical protein
MTQFNRKFSDVIPDTLKDGLGFIASYDYELLPTFVDAARKAGLNVTTRSLDSESIDYIIILRGDTPITHQYLPDRESVIVDWADLFGIPIYYY